MCSLYGLKGEDSFNFRAVQIKSETVYYFDTCTSKNHLWRRQDKKEQARGKINKCTEDKWNWTWLVQRWCMSVVKTKDFLHTRSTTTNLAARSGRTPNDDMSVVCFFYLFCIHLLLNLHESKWNLKSNGGLQNCVYICVLSLSVPDP